MPSLRSSIGFTERFIFARACRSQQVDLPLHFRHRRIYFGKPGLVRQGCRNDGHLRNRHMTIRNTAYFPLCTCHLYPRTSCPHPCFTAAPICGQQRASRLWLTGPSEDRTRCKILIRWRSSALDLVAANVWIPRHNFAVRNTTMSGFRRRVGKIRVGGDARHGCGLIPMAHRVMDGLTVLTLVFLPALHVT